jgi:hypothetical protein
MNCYSTRQPRNKRVESVRKSTICQKENTPKKEPGTVPIERERKREREREKGFIVSGSVVRHSTMMAGAGGQGMT